MENFVDTETPAFKDQSGWLKAIGAYYLIVGSILGLSQLRLLMAPARSLSPLTMLNLLLVLAGVLKRVALGWGTWHARRWARVLALISSWFDLLVGVVMVPTMVWMLQRMPTQLSPKAKLIMGLSMSGVSLIFSVVLPGLLILFFRRADVKQTCEAQNPAPSWTDASPSPVIGLALFIAFSGLYSIAASLMPGVKIPVAIWTVSGLLGVLVPLIYGAGLLYCAYWVYRMNYIGFIWAAGLCLAGFINGFLFYRAHGWDGLMSLTGKFTADSPEVLSMMTVMDLIMAYIYGASAIALSAYFVFVQQRYFRKTPLIAL